MAIRAQREDGEIAPIYPQPGSRRRWMGLGVELDGTKKFSPTAIRSRTIQPVTTTPLRPPMT